VLAEASEYYNTGAEKYGLPEETDGQTIWGVKDDCVVS
jgi:hypothetical protein